MRTPRLLPALLLVALVPCGAGLRGEEPGVGGPRARVTVAAAGFVRVKARALQALGFRAEQHVVVTRRGRRLPALQTRVGDDVVFLANDLPAPHTRQRVYTLAPGAAQERLRPPDSPPPLAGLVLPRDEAHAARWDDTPRLHGDLAAAEQEVYAAPAPSWFRERLPLGGELSLAVPPECVPGAPLTLSLEVHGTQPGGVLLGLTHAGRELRRTGTVGVSFELEAVDPTQPLVLKNLAPLVPAPRNDVSDGRGTVWIRHLVWSGPVDAGRAQGPLLIENTQRLLAVRGLPRPGWHLLAVDLEGGLLGEPELFASSAASPLAGVPAGWAVLRGVGEGYAGSVVVAPEREAAPEALAAPPADLALRAMVEHLIVCVPALRPASERLAAHRRTQGISSAVVTTEEVDQVFGDGDRDPQALRRFLCARRLREQLPSLRYVLLVGDATLDRTDLAPFETLPALMARTQYNGATPADTLYVEGDGEPETDPPVVGRLPFQDPATLERFVDRLVAYETAPPRDASRRTLRFLASEGRFGALADAMIEMFFKRIVGNSVSPAYDVEVTFASQVSAFLWPPREFGTKVIESINQGALFYTYVGHGFAQGFDSLHVGDERFPILHLADAQAIDVRGTPPVMIAVACTTAQFDDPRASGLGETLLARPQGPIAYVGATRICHPAGNAFLGRSIARAMFPPGGGTGAGQTRRLGEVLAAARREVLDPRRDDPLELRQLTLGTGMLLPPGTSLERIKQEAFWLYNLLGDPGTRLAVPDRELEVTATRAGETVEVEVRGASEGERVEVTVELPRAKQHPFLPVERGLKAGDPSQAEAIRRNHSHANEKVVLRAGAVARDGVARLTLTPAPDTHGLGHASYGGAYQVKASTRGPGPVGLGVALLLWEGASSPDGAADTPK